MGQIVKRKCVLQDDFDYEEEEDCCEFECIPLKSVFTGERDSDDEGDGDPDLRCRDFFNTRSPDLSTTSQGPFFRPGSIFGAPGALRGPPEAENYEKPPS